MRDPSGQYVVWGTAADDDYVVWGTTIEGANGGR
jgi:hypothetical protein